VRITLISLVVCLALSVVLALAVSDGDNALVRFDHHVVETLHEHASPALIDVFKGVTWFGSPALWIINPCAGVFLLWRRRWDDLLTGLMVIGGGELLSTFLKELIARPRPVWTDPIVVEKSFAFPSGHAMSSLLTYGFLALLLGRALYRRRARAALVVGTVLLIGLIGFSRLVLGVHYPSDVLGGYTIGGAWFSLCLMGKTVVERAAAGRDVHQKQEEKNL
jgi:undecaprenyl-diphosphatase